MKIFGLMKFKTAYRDGPHKDTSTLTITES